MPLNTRDGVAEAPIEPGARTLCEPWDLGPLAKLWRLIVPWKPLPLDLPEILTLSPTAKRVDGDGLADEQLAGLVAELDEVTVRRRVGLLQVSELGLRERLLLAGAERELDGLVAVALRGADRGHRAGPGLEHGDALDAAVVEEPLGHSELLGEDRGHGSGGEADLDVHAGRQVVEALQRVDRLGRRLMDVDQPLVGADLEVLA